MACGRWRVLPGWAVLPLAAAVWWVVGFLPWIVEGMHLSSSAWPMTLTLEGPVAALPFSEFGFPTLLVCGVIGGTAALAVSRLAAPGVSHPRLLAATGGVVAVLASLAQTWRAIEPAKAETDEATLLLVALVVATVVFAAVGLLVGAGVARGRGWPWVLGGATGASLSGSWVLDLLDRGQGPLPGWLAQVLLWHPWVVGILLGGVLAVVGFRPTGRVVRWVVALAIAWVVPSVLTAMTYAVFYFSQGPVTRAHAMEVLDAGSEVFVQSLSPGDRHLGSLVLAVVIGVTGSWRRRA